jgi:spermidine/putrescine transport system ATP-binding protein
LLRVEARHRLGGLLLDVALTVERGECLALAGPSGAGKTSVLRVAAGLLRPEQGRVDANGSTWLDTATGVNVPADQRRCGYVFQHYALFPHLSAWQNVAYPLRGMSRSERRARALELLDRFGLGHHAEARPHTLSGGERQRVAVARALARDPEVLLLDEPLSALDLKLRQHMRNELRTIQRMVGITFIYITHDQGEALTMSDRIAVMSDGVIQQIGDGKAIYDEPATAFVASFVGENNPFAGTVAQANASFALIETKFGRLRGRNPRGLKQGDKAILFVRPESARLTPGATDTTFTSRVKSVAFEGNMTHVFLEGAGKKDITVTVGRHNGAAIPEQGSVATVSYDAELGLALPEGKMARE